MAIEAFTPVRLWPRIVRMMALADRMRAHPRRPRSLRSHMVLIVVLSLLPPTVVQIVGAISLVPDVTGATAAPLQDVAETLAIVVSRELDLAGLSGEAVTAALRAPDAEATAPPSRVAAASGAQAGRDRQILRARLQIDALLATPLVPAGAIGLLVSPDGAIFARGDGGSLTVTPAMRAAIRAALADPSRRTIDVGPGEATAAFATLRAAPAWRVVVIQPAASLMAWLSGPVAVIAAGAVISVAIAVIAALYAGGWLATPLRRLTAAAQSVAAGDDTLGDVPNSAVTEFNDLRSSVARADAVLRRHAAAERQALQEARTGHELLQSVVNATADLIFVKDLEQRYVLANRSALVADWVMRDEWQVLGRRATDVLPMASALRLEAVDRDVMATRGPRTVLMEWPHGDGTVHLYAVVNTPWRDAAGDLAGVVTVMHDITDQRAAEQRLAAVQGELLRATRLSAMGAMASGLAHELNQPLAAATNFLNAAARILAREGHGRDGAMAGQGAAQGSGHRELVRAAVTDAAEQTLRAGAIVRRLRDFVGRGEADLNLENIGEIVGEIRRVACADGAIEERQIVIDPGDPDLMMLVERTQIQQVLLNLIKNASEALGATPDGRIVLSWRAADVDVEIIVADNGPGLAPDIRDRLFQPFASTKALGMGIGLAICRTIVEGHGGSLVAEDNPGGGALFRITLPPAGHAAEPTQECAT